MVAVEVTNKYPRYDGWGYVGKNELSLGPLSWIKEEAFIIPTDEIGAVIAKTGGLLAGASQNNDIARTHF